MNESDLPALNAAFNGLATLLLVAGFVAIRRGHRDLHGRLMKLAFAASTCFLAGYLWYHFAVVPELGHTKLNAAGLAQTAYYALLVSHVVLAIVNLPMVLRTLWLAHRQDWERHRRLARVTFPIWLYVSVTGVVVYVVLYHLNPAT